MKKIPRKWLIIGGLILLTPFILEITGLFAYGKWRYEMTVVVETPEGIKTGSAVRQVSNSSFIRLINWPGAGPGANFKGEAVAVDLGKRDYLFAILGVNPEYEYYGAYPNPHGAGTVAGIRYYNWMLWGKKKTILNPETFTYYPTFVTFKDINDPKSVELVFAIDRTGLRYDAPNKIIDNVEEVFGKDVRIKEVSIERTRELVTWGVVEILQWLPQYYGKKFDGRRYETIKAENILANSLSAGSFSAK